MGDEDAMTVDGALMRRKKLEPEGMRNLVLGDTVRDFAVRALSPCWFPYDEHNLPLPRIAELEGWLRHLWLYRTELASRSTFTGQTYSSAGRPFYDWHQLPKDIGAHSYALPFAAVATHNHLALDRRRSVFKQSAPIVKLPEAATEGDHFALLGLLNSSTACFWLKQNSHSKGHGGIGGGIASEEWEKFYDFTGTTLQDFPLPPGLPTERGRLLDDLAQEQISLSPTAVASITTTPTRQMLDEAHVAH